MYPEIEQRLIFLSTNIEGQIKTLANLIRTYSREQTPTWQQIPYWALEANGRGRFSPLLTRAYEQREWGIINGIYVNLTNGDLMFHQRHKEPLHNIMERCQPNNVGDIKPGPTPDYLIIPLAPQLNLLDAKSILEKLREHANNPYDDQQDPRDVEQWRERKRMEFNVPYLGVVK